MSADRTDEILERFREGGGRVTDARRAVVEALVGASSHHVTAPDVLDALRATDPDFHESTVYRTLDRLAELDVVTRIEAPGAAAVYHLPHRAHHHLVCDTCGQIVGASPDLLAEVAERLADEQGFVLRAEAVSLPGRCSACDGGGSSITAPGLDDVVDAHLDHVGQPTR